MSTIYLVSFSRSRLSGAWYVASGAIEQFQCSGLSRQGTTSQLTAHWFVAPGAKALSRKEQPHMSIALRNKQVFALIVLALLTILALTFILLTTVAHIDVWHSLTFLVPDAFYPRG